MLWTLQPEKFTYAQKTSMAQYIRGNPAIGSIRKLKTVE